MAIVKMKKVRIIAVRDRRDQLMRELRRLGCVEIRQPEEDPETETRLRPERAGLAAARARCGEAEAALNTLSRYAPEKKKLLAARPLVKEDEFLDDGAMERDYALVREINERESEIRRLAAEETRIWGEITALSPWQPLDMPLECSGTKTCGVSLFSVPAQVDMQSVADAAQTVTEEMQVILVSEDEVQHCFVVVARREDLPAIGDVLRQTGSVPVSFPGMTGTAGVNITARRAKLNDVRHRQEQLAAEIAEMRSRGRDLRLSADRLSSAAEQAEATEHLLGTDSVTVLEGWCPAPETERLAAVLKDLDCAWEFSDPAPEEYPDVPVKLQNNKITRPMNMVTEMYSLPAYSGVDPNPLMFPFFILFYGMMMADMGYGILMLLMGLVLKKSRPRGMMDYMSGLLLMGGVSTFLFGAVTGSFFGDFLTQAAKLLGKDLALPSLFTPLDDTLAILVGSMALGLVHIITGMAVSFIRKIRAGQVLDALFEEVAWWVVFAGLGAMFLLRTNLVLYAGLILVVAGPIITGKGLGKITGIFGSLYNHVTGFFGDILSYSRLMALMLAGSVISQVFNTLGAIPGNIVIFVIISMAGNALNFALNLLGCYVHDLRLQCLEFFNKFYEDGGKPFRPLDIKAKSVDIVKE